MIQICFRSTLGLLVRYLEALRQAPANTSIAHPSLRETYKRGPDNFFNAQGAISKTTRHDGSHFLRQSTARTFVPLSTPHPNALLGGRISVGTQLAEFLYAQVCDEQAVNYTSKISASAVFSRPHVRCPCSWSRLVPVQGVQLVQAVQLT
eukprot:350657-Chlamydomonas_euryale.AAC.5